MVDIYENTAEYNAFKKRETIIVFDDMIADMLSNKKLNIKGTESFIRGRKLNISHIFITQSDFAMPESIRRHSTHYFIMKTPTNKNFNKFHSIIHHIFDFGDISY